MMLLRQIVYRSAVVSSRALRPSPHSASTAGRWITRAARPSSLLPARPAAGTPRTYASSARSEADEKMDLIQDQYATAKDEFEIAVEETEKKTVYAADDRAAAVEECNKLKEMFEAAVKSSPPDVAAEITKRVGQRIRELDEAIKGLEAAAMED